MIIINAPLKREDFKRIIKETVGEVEIIESGMKLSFTTNNEDEDFKTLKANIKADATCKALYSQVTRED